MNKATLTVDLNIDDLRQGAALFNNMADMLDNGVSAKTETTNNDDYDYEDDNPWLGEFTLAGIEIDVYAKSPLTSQQAMELPVDVLEKHIGRIIDKSETDKTAADAFGGDDEKIDLDNPHEMSKANDVDLDADGIPWDARIHGASKARLARGNTWKLKRGVDKELVTTVIAELKALMSAPAATTAAPDNVTNIADAKPATPAGPAGPGPASPAKPAAPETPAIEVKYVTDDGEWTREQLKGAMYTDEAIDALPIAGNIAPAEVTFPELMQLITPALAAKTITDEQVTAACVKHGVTSIALIAARPDLIPAVKTELFG